MNVRVSALASPTSGSAAPNPCRSSRNGAVFGRHGALYVHLGLPAQRGDAEYQRLAVLRSQLVWPRTEMILLRSSGERTSFTQPCSSSALVGVRGRPTQRHWR
jgi:hypothetical protein